MSTSKIRIAAISGTFIIIIAIDGLILATIRWGTRIIGTFVLIIAGKRSIIITALYMIAIIDGTFVIIITIYIFKIATK